MAVPRATARRIGRVAAVTAASAGLLLAGAVPALADDPGGPQGPITLSPEQATFVCTRRIPAILSRIDRVTTRINADATTRGSTAWLQARQDKAESAGNTELAERIQQRIDGRPARLDALSDAKQRVTAFRAANCAS